MSEVKHEVRANVRVHLTNPESGYESETEARATADEWVVIDAILCGHARSSVYMAAPDLLEVLTKSAEGWANAIELGIILPQHVTAATVLRDEARAAIQKAVSE